MASVARRSAVKPVRAMESVTVDLFANFIAPCAVRYYDHYNTMSGDSFQPWLSDSLCVSRAKQSPQYPHGYQNNHLTGIPKRFVPPYI